MVEQSLRKGEVRGSTPLIGSHLTSSLKKLKSYVMARFYSRLTRVEEKRNIRKASVYIISTIALVVILIMFGLPTMAKLAGFLTNLKSSATPVEQNDTTPPAPPQIETPAEYVNTDQLGIKGTAESGATIVVNANGSKEETTADRDGLFNYTFSLVKGENTFSVSAKDSSGNESQTSKVYTINFDDEAPTIEVSAPEDGKSFYGSKQRQIVIEGTTDGSTLTINGRVVVVENDGSFTYAISLQEGDNNFEIVAEDQAGNKTTEKLTVSYWK